MLGLYVSDHPLMGFEAALARHTDCSLSDMRDDETGLGDRSPVRSVGGVVTELRRSYTKKGDLMARFVLEDLQAAMEVFVFPRTMADYGALIENDAIVVVEGRLDTREEEPKIVAMEVARPLLDRGLDLFAPELGKTAGKVQSKVVEITRTLLVRRRERSVP